MVVVALRGPWMKAPPNVIATLIRRHFNGLRGPPVVGTPNATHEGISYVHYHLKNRLVPDRQRNPVKLLEQPYDIQYSIMEQLLGCLADDLCYGTKPLTVQQAKKMRTIKAFKLRGAVKEGLTSYLVASSYAREIWKREEESLFARLRDNLLRKCEDHAAKAKSNRLRKKL
jgi:hypothetical protein